MIAEPNCYVCQQPVLPDDKPAYKTIDGVQCVRHYWHIAPNHDLVQGGVRYATDLEQAKEWATQKLASPYPAPEQKARFQNMLDEANRLLDKNSEVEHGR